MKLDHVAIIVSNLETSVNFYVEFLGLKIKRKFALTETESRALFNISAPAQAIQLVMEEGMIELFDFEGDTSHADRLSSPPANGLFHFALHVNQPIDEFVDRARQKGIPVFSLARGRHCVYFIQDPDGVLIETMQ